MCSSASVFPTMTLVFITQTLFLSVSPLRVVRRSVHNWSIRLCTRNGCFKRFFSSSHYTFLWVSFPIIFEILDQSLPIYLKPSSNICRHICHCVSSVHSTSSLSNVTILWGGATAILMAFLRRVYVY